MSFSREEREDLGSSVLFIDTRREITLEVPPDLPDGDAKESLEVIFAKYGRPTQVTVEYSDKTKPEPPDGPLSLARRRIMGIVISMGFKRKHLSPFKAVQSSRFRAELPPAGGRS